MGVGGQRTPKTRRTLEFLRPSAWGAGIWRAAAARLDLTAPSQSQDTLTPSALRSRACGLLGARGCVFICSHTAVSKGVWEKGGTPDYKEQDPRDKNDHVGSHCGPDQVWE